MNDVLYRHYAMLGEGHSQDIIGAEASPADDSRLWAAAAEVDAAATAALVNAATAFAAPSSTLWFSVAFASPARIPQPRSGAANLVRLDPSTTSIQLLPSMS